MSNITLTNEAHEKSHKRIKSTICRYFHDGVSHFPPIILRGNLPMLSPVIFKGTSFRDDFLLNHIVPVKVDDIWGVTMLPQ